MYGRNTGLLLLFQKPYQSSSYMIITEFASRESTTIIIKKLLSVLHIFLQCWKELVVCRRYSVDSWQLSEQNMEFNGKIYTNILYSVDFIQNLTHL